MNEIADLIFEQAAVLIWAAGVLAALAAFLFVLDRRRRRRQARLDAMEAIVQEARRVQGIPPEHRDTGHLKAMLNAEFGANGQPYYGGRYPAIQPGEVIDVNSQYPAGWEGRK